MSGRSPSGVASLRARFEHKGESTSPPSRGRSPAGSATSESSRPLSKVRTSFVSVEGSGKMGDQLGMKETTGSEAVVDVGVNGSKAAADGDAPKKPQSNGFPVQSTSAEDSRSGVDSTKEPKHGSPTIDTNRGATDGSSDANPDKPVSSAEDGTAKMLPSDPKDEAVVSGGAALGTETRELGSILKGSPFEQEKADKASPSKPSKSPKAAAPSRSPKKPSKASANPTVNGKHKETVSSKPAPQTKPKAAPLGTSAGTNVTSPPDPSKSPKVPESKPTGKGLPAEVGMQSGTSPAASNATDASKSKGQKTTSPGPRTPTSATAVPGKQSTPQRTSPKSQPPRDANGGPAKDMKKPTSRSSAASKPASSKPSKPAPLSGSSTAQHVKKTESTSPKQPSTKSRPKSPTRPVRLPAAATAPTAASAAKVDGSSPADNSGKPKSTLSNTLHAVGKPNPNSSKSQPKSGRTSLPTGSKPVDKLKAAKPRMSMASAKAPEGSFLERMMRPTQSSSQKTHEKAPKPPQSKHQGAKPKRLSEGSDKSKAEHEEAKIEPTKESASEDQPPVESSGSPSINGASISASAAAHTIPATNPAP